MSIPDYISEKVTDAAVLKRLRTVAQKRTYCEKAPRLQVHFCSIQLFSFPIVSPCCDSGIGAEDPTGPDNRLRYETQRNIYIILYININIINKFI